MEIEDEIINIEGKVKGELEIRKQYRSPLMYYKECLAL